MRPLFVILLLLGSAASALAQVRQDVHGDPLPAGAVARLGTVRLRPDGRVNYLAFSPDGRRLASATSAGLYLWDSASGRELRHVPLIDARFAALTWLADGRGIALLQRGDDSFSLWDFTDEKAERPPVNEQPLFGKRAAGEDHETLIQFAVSPDGRWLAAGRHGSHNRARAVDVWELAAGGKLGEPKRKQILGSQQGDCTGLAFTPDGRRLLAFSREKNASEELLVVWDLDSGKEQRRMTVPQTTWGMGYHKVCAVAADGRTLALGLSDGTVRVLDLAGERLSRSVADHADQGRNARGVTAGAFSPDGRSLVTAGRDRTLRVWDVATGKAVRTLDGNSHGWILAVAFTPDGKGIAAGQTGGIRLWDLDTGNDRCPLGGHRAVVLGVAIAFDGKTVATIGGDATLRFWDPVTSRERFRTDLGDVPSRSTITPDGKTVLVGVGRSLRLWDAASGQPSVLPGELAAAVGSLHGFAPDGRTLLTSDKGTVSLWDWLSGRRRQMVTLPAEPYKPEELVCSAASLSPDGRVLITSSERHTQRKVGDVVQGSVFFVATELWDAKTGQRRMRLEPPANPYSKHAFLPEGCSFLLTGSVSQSKGSQDPDPLAGALSLWDPVTARFRRNFASPRESKPGDYRRIEAFALSPDGRALAAAENDRTLTLYEVASGGVRRRLLGHRQDVLAVAFTPDGRRLVTASGDHTGLVWDVSLAGAAAGWLPPTAAEVEQAWTVLADGRADAAHKALALLAAAPEAAIVLVKRHIRPRTGPDVAALDKLLADLDNVNFAVRERASVELDRLGQLAVDAVRERAAKVTSAEVRARLARFLEKHDRAEPTPEELREGRALELLEQLGSAEARAVLKAWAAGPPEARLTKQAAAALRRLPY